MSPTQRSMGAVSSLLLAVALLGPAAAAPPNVVLILSDDQHWSDYGFMGHGQPRPPAARRRAGPPSRPVANG